MGNIIKENSIIFNQDDSLERLKMEQVYLDYIKEHINFVKKAYVLYMVPLLEKTSISTKVSDEELKKAIIELSTIIETHDASKMSDAEFDGYRAKWHPTQLEKNGDDEYQKYVDDRYEECWRHHYTTNDHHPKFWYDEENKVAKDMCLRAIVEMLCDWEAMSMKFQTNTLDWYENKAIDEKNVMNDKTKDIVESLLHYLHG